MPEFTDAELRSIISVGDDGMLDRLRDDQLERAMLLGRQLIADPETQRARSIQNLLDIKAGKGFGKGRGKGTSAEGFVPPELAADSHRPDRVIEDTLDPPVERIGASRVVPEELLAEDPQPRKVKVPGRPEVVLPPPALIRPPSPIIPVPGSLIPTVGKLAEGASKVVDTTRALFKVMFEEETPLRFSAAPKAARAVLEAPGLIVGKQLAGENPLGGFVVDNIEALTGLGELLLPDPPQVIAIEGPGGGVTPEEYLILTTPELVSAQPGLMTIDGAEVQEIAPEDRIHPMALPGVPPAAMRESFSGPAQAVFRGVEILERSRRVAQSVGGVLGFMRAALGPNFVREGEGPVAIPLEGPAEFRGGAIRDQPTPEREVLKDFATELMTYMGTSMAEFINDPEGQVERDPTEAIENLGLILAPTLGPTRRVAARVGALPAQATRPASAARLIATYIRGGPNALREQLRRIGVRDEIAAARKLAARREAERAFDVRAGTGRIKTGEERFTQPPVLAERFTDPDAARFGAAAEEARRVVPEQLVAGPEPMRRAPVKAGTTVSARRAAQEANDELFFRELEQALDDNVDVAMRQELAKADKTVDLERTANTVRALSDENPEAPAAISRSLDNLDRKFTDAEEFLAQQGTPEGTRGIQRLRDIEARRNEMRSAIEKTTAEASDFEQDMTRIIHEAKVAKEGVGAEAAAMRQILDRMSEVAGDRENGKRFLAVQQLKELLQSIEKRTGKKVPLAVGAALLAGHLLGEDALNDDLQMANLGALVVLSSIPLMRTVAAKNGRLTSAVNLIADRGAAKLWRGDVKGLQAFKQAMRKDDDFKDAVELLEKYDPDGLRLVYDRSTARLAESMDMVFTTGANNVTRMLQAIRKGESGRSWYRGARHEITRLLGDGDEAELLFDLIAATTNNKQPRANLSTALNVLAQIQAAGGVQRLRKLAAAGELNTVEKLGKFIDLPETYKGKELIAGRVGVGKVGPSDEPKSTAGEILEIIKGKRKYENRWLRPNDPDSWLGDSKKQNFKIALAWDSHPDTTPIGFGKLKRTRAQWAENAVVLDQVFAKGIQLTKVNQTELNAALARGLPANQATAAAMRVKDGFKPAQYRFWEEVLRETTAKANEIGLGKKLGLKEPLRPRDVQAMFWVGMKRSKPDAVGAYNEQSASFQAMLLRQLTDTSEGFAKPERHAWRLDPDGRNAAIRAQSEEVVDLVVANGGATYQPYSGLDMGGKPGVAASLGPKNEIVFDGRSFEGLKLPTVKVDDAQNITELDRALVIDAVRQFMERRTTFLVDPKHTVGAWFNSDGFLELNISIVASHADPEGILRVAKLAKKAGQESLFDLRTFEELRDGQSIFETATRAGLRRAPKAGEVKALTLNERQLQLDPLQVDRLISSEGAPIVRVTRGQKPLVPSLLAPLEGPGNQTTARARRIAAQGGGPAVAARVGERGLAQRELVTTLALSPLGYMAGAWLSTKLNEDGVFDFGPSLRLIGVVAGAGFSRYLNNPAVRKALHNVMSLGPDAPDFEKAAEVLITPLLPEKINGDRASKLLTKAGILAGAAGGVGVAALSEERAPSIPLTAASAAMGAMIGRAGAMKVVERLFRRDWHPRAAYRRLFTESRGVPTEFNDLRLATQRRLQGRVSEIRDTAEQLNRFDEVVNSQVDEFLRGNRALDSLPKAVQDAALRTRMIFDELALDMVAMGMVDGALKEKLISNVGTYLPRLYLEFETSTQVAGLERAVSWAQANKIPIPKLSDRDFLKQRMPAWLHKQLTNDGVLNEITSNPAYLLAKRGTVATADVENLRFMRQIASSEWVLPNAMLPRQVADKEVAAFAKSVGQKVPRKGDSDEFFLMVQQIRDAERGGLQQANVFKEGKWQVAEWDGKRFLKMPDDDKYGPLRNAYLDEDIALDQITRHKTADTFFQVLNDSGLAFFKTGKVLWNPATLARNLWSNFILADMGGLSPARIGHYASTLKDFVKGGEDFLEARRIGLFGGEFRQAEVQQLLSGIAAGTKGDSALAKASLGLINITKGAGVGKIKLEQLEKFHEASEKFFKLALFRWGKRKGMGAEASRDFALRWIFDYNQVPKWVDVTRRSIFGAPFITFSYKSIPRIIENAIAVGDPRKLWRFWKWPMMIGASNEFAARQFGDEFIKEGGRNMLDTLKRVTLSGLGFTDPFEFKKWLPDYAGPQQVLLPTTDVFGRHMSVDITWTMPWGNLGEVGRGPLGRNLAKAGIAWPDFIEPGNPWLHAMVGATAGIDMFTGRDIIAPGATPAEASIDQMTYHMRLWGPQLLNPAGFGFEKMRRALQTDIGSDPFSPGLGSAIVSELFGFKTRPFDPNRSFVFRRKTLNREVGRIKWYEGVMRDRGMSEFWIRRRQARRQALLREFESRFGMSPPPENPLLQQAIEEQLEKNRERAAGGNPLFDVLGGQ